ncbi:MAG TPA: hypothetical protein VNQ74_08460, partial [Burkholderiaceae bacterium]|nr:hypothetical protein [Burkholderiaceae bacterium]
MHVPVVRTGKAEFAVMLGPVPAGTHTVAVIEDQILTAATLRGKAAATWSIAVEQVQPESPDAQALSLAPFVYARPDTVGKFNDVPLLMWYEIEPTERGKRYRYSVIFSNEDGGTPTDRLMATWGRTTDIEYIYSVEVDASGAILNEDMQGPDHEILPFKGKREGRHPLLWVATHNNMVLDHGTTSVRYAPAPKLVDLTNTSREKVMDDNPWTYSVMAKELAREGKIVADAPTGQDTIPDPRRYVFLEGCGDAGNNALTVSARVDGNWLSSDRGVEQYRITRNGCFRAAVPLPANKTARDVDAIRINAFTRKDKPANTPSTLTRINTMFSLNDLFIPGPPLANWLGHAVLQPNG